GPMRALVFTLCIGFVSFPQPAHSANAPNSSPQLAFVGAWPHHVVIFDSASEKILGSIDLKTDAPRMLMLSPDKKTLYASTLNDNAIVSVDLATRTVTSSFSLDSGSQTVRLYGL